MESKLASSTDGAAGATFPSQANQVPAATILSFQDDGCKERSARGGASPAAFSKISAPTTRTKGKPPSSQLGVYPSNKDTRPRSETNNPLYTGMAAKLKEDTVKDSGNDVGNVTAKRRGKSMEALKQSSHNQSITASRDGTDRTTSRSFLEYLGLRKGSSVVDPKLSRPQRRGTGRLRVSTDSLRSWSTSADVVHALAKDLATEVARTDKIVIASEENFCAVVIPTGLAKFKFLTCVLAIMFIVANYFLRSEFGSDVAQLGAYAEANLEVRVNICVGGYVGVVQRTRVSEYITYGGMVLSALVGMFLARSLIKRRFQRALHFRWGSTNANAYGPRLYKVRFTPTFRYV